CPDRTIGLERQAVLPASRNRYGSSQSGHLNRYSYSAISGGVKGAIAQLTRVAGTPCPDRTIGLERQAVRKATRNRRDSSQSAHLHRYSYSAISGGVKVAFPQLAVTAEAPRPDRSIGLERQAVIRATS